LSFAPTPLLLAMEDRENKHLVGDVPMLGPKLKDDHIRQTVNDPLVGAADRADVSNLRKIAKPGRIGADAPGDIDGSLRVARIIAVPEFEFERWTRFSNGMTIRLDCMLEPVLGWWNRLSSRSPGGLRLDPRVCELFK